MRAYRTWRLAAASGLALACAVAFSAAMVAAAATPVHARTTAAPGEPACPTFDGPALRVRAFGDVLLLPSYLLLTPDPQAAPGTARLGFSRVVNGRDDEYVGSIKYGAIVQSADATHTLPAASEIEGDVVMRVQRGGLAFTVIALPRPLPFSENPVDAVLVVEGAGARAEFWSGDGAEEAMAVFNRFFDDAGTEPGACLRAPTMPEAP